MENGGNGNEAPAWRFGAASPGLEAARAQSIRALVYRMYDCLDRGDARPVAPAFACFRTAPAATDAVAAAAASGAHNTYAPAAGLAEACRYVYTHELLFSVCDFFTIYLLWFFKVPFHNYESSVSLDITDLIYAATSRNFIGVIRTKIYKFAYKFMLKWMNC
uniref:Uncharacterized protein n=1 Tax=Oryza brachyantha TaxID=4533 RepID=J3LC21_ORYBR